jgi:hypothetical protein
MPWCARPTAAARSGSRRKRQRPGRIDCKYSQLYIVHMKYVTASEARKNWFQLLDEAANGEIIAIQRDDKKLILKVEKTKPRTPNYKGLIHFEDADDADTWSWQWKGPGRLISKSKPKPKK